MFLSFLKFRCATGQFQLPEETSPKLEEKLDDFSRKRTALKETLNRFQGRENKTHFEWLVAA